MEEILIIFLICHKVVSTYAYDAVWMGLNELRSKYMYEWTDHSPVTYTNWNTLEPNNYQGRDEPCGAIWVKVSNNNEPLVKRFNITLTKYFYLKYLVGNME